MYSDRDVSPSRRGWSRRFRALAIGTLVALVAVLGAAVPAYAADATLTLTKSVDGAQSKSLAPGGEFTYQLQVGCDDLPCASAQLTDTLPPEFAGFAILQTTVSPSGQPASFAYTGCTTAVTAACTLTVDFKQPIGGTDVGIQAGSGYRVAVTLKAPADLPATWPYNGKPVTNNADVTSTTANPVTDDAEVTVSIPITVDTDVSKSWAPASQLFQPGAASTVTLGTRNRSNVFAESLGLIEPTSAVAGQAALGSDNPFDLVDFTGFGPVTAPAGATLVQVDAYVLDTASNTYEWVPGQPRAPADIALPDGVAAADVAGLRITFTSADGAAIAPSGAAGSVPLIVAQRGTSRITGTPLVGGATVTNSTTGTVRVPGQSDVSKTATAPFSIGAISVDVVAGKTITPGRIAAGLTAQAEITAKNNSNGSVSELSLADLGFFTDKLTFGGFTNPLAYPVNATGGSLRWHYSDGSVVTVPFADGARPTPPAAPAGAHLTGFETIFSVQPASAPGIPSGALTSVDFGITSAADIVAKGESPTTIDNSVTAAVVNGAGRAENTASASFDVFFPEISVALDKKISPSAPVSPGGTVVAQLPTTTATDSAFVNPTTIVVTDVWNPADASNFWNAFNPIALAPTQVFAGSTLTIEYTTDGVTWIPFPTAGVCDANPLVYQCPFPPEVTASRGLRYTFANPAGYPQGTQVSPNTVFQARSDKRDGTGPTSVVDAPASVYTNTAAAQGTGSVPGAPDVTSDVVTDTANASIRTVSGEGNLAASKDWRSPDLSQDLTALSSQSGAAAGTRLGWGVSDTGFSSVTVSDPNGNENAPQFTTFQAFDLTGVLPRTFAQEPLLRWDAVSSVELYSGGGWTTVPPPPGGWMSPAGFVGYTLTPAQRDATTGVRITVVPNDAARSGSSDPLAPPVGSGIATSAAGGGRFFGLTWQLRNAVRVNPVIGDSPWVTAGRQFNVPGAPGEIINTMRVDGVRNGSPVAPAAASDIVTLIDQPPGVSITKATQRTSIVLPKPGDVDPSQYPTNDYTVVAKNTSSARASYIRVSDPMPCDAGNLPACASAANGWNANPYAAAAYVPSTNPFERFTLTGIDFSAPAGQVDRDQSTVTLWHRSDAGALTTSTLTLTQADALPASQLLDVVGVSVLYQGTDPAINGGLIEAGSALQLVLHTQARVNLRSAPATPVSPVTVNNYSFTQGYDPVLSPSAKPTATANRSLTLVKGKLGVLATKTIAPASLIEANRANPVTATLKATSGTGNATATVATNEVVIEDTGAAFWDALRLASFAPGDVTKPAGADRVRVDVRVNGETTWITGTAAAAAALPASVTDLSTITGIRFVFNRADGGLFSRSAVPANFTATAVLRLQVRDALLSSGGPIVFPSTFSNALHAVSHRYDDPEIYTDATSDTTANFALQPGTFTLDVVKFPQGNLHTVFPGDSVPWTLRFTNTGTGFLTIPNLTDTLPTTLEWDGVDPTYATSAGGLLSTNPTVSFDAATRALTFVWPAAGQRMAPGESFTITLGLILQPGLTGSQRATNSMVVNTGQTLAGCSNTSGNGQGTISGLPPTACGTTNFVQPVAGGSLVTTKGVKGDVVNAVTTGGYNVTSPNATCTPDANGYYRYPCAAQSVVGGTDEWRIDAINSGTIAYDNLTLVDPLPFPGDRLLAGGASRGSQFRPSFDSTFGAAVTAPPGTTKIWEVTTAANVCVGTGTGSAWSGRPGQPADPTCSNNPPNAQWIDGTTFTGDWDTVTGLRVRFDFTTTRQGGLLPGGAVNVVFRTVNVPATATRADGASVTTPVPGQVAWNQSGASATLATGTVISRAPAKTGIHLPFSTLQVVKTVSGDAASYAPDTFTFAVACTVAGAPVNLGASALLSVPKNGSAQIPGIPLGATCTVTEQGDFGETSRNPATPQTLRILDATTLPVPAAQVATFDNAYDYGDLSVTKVVDTEANVGAFGPFTFHATCTAPPGSIGGTVLDEDFTLSDGDTWKAPADTLPQRSSCLISETDAGSATGVAFTGAGATDNGDGSVAAVIGSAVDITATNTFAVGVLDVTKAVTGAGADRYGSGPFVIQAVCSWPPGSGTEVYTGTVTVVDGDTARFTLPNGDDALMPVGTDCVLTEPKTGGATGAPVFGHGGSTSESSITVAIENRDDGTDVGHPTLVTADNPFDVGEITVKKFIEGRGGDVYGAGPFTVRVECTYDKDGVETPITWNDEDYLDVVLDQANGFSAVVDDLLIGSTCEVTQETVTGGAAETVIGPSVIVPASGGDTVSITVTNTFRAGDLLIVKQRTGAFEQFGAGPFTAQVTCQWTVDGVLQDIPVPGGPTVNLNAANGYRVLIDLLPVGAECTVTETDAGVATSTSYSPSDGTVAILENDRLNPAPAVATVTITNDFDPAILAKTGVDGDATSLATLIAVLLLGGGGALVVAGTRRRRRS